MIVVAALAIFVGFTVLVLAAGYAFGRAEAAEEYEWQITELERTIDQLVSPTVRIHG